MLPKINFLNVILINNMGIFVQKPELIDLNTGFFPTLEILFWTLFCYTLISLDPAIDATTATANFVSEMSRVFFSFFT